ncbi:MAG: hypothetical protein WDZ94_03100 [Patescibacteria group bacterium]
MRSNHKKTAIYGCFLRCEPIVPQLEPLLDSVFQTYEHLKQLGFTYFDKKVTIIEMEGDADAQ